MTKRVTVVFDIDLTIAYGIDDRRTTEGFKTHFPDAIFAKDDWNYTYLMSPHFNSLLKYLLSKNCRIVFFSSAPFHRNEYLVANYLKHDKVFGKDEYERLKSEGQFDVFSINHTHLHELVRRKGLVQVLKPGETIDDIILVDDNSNTAACELGEETFISYYWWHLSIETSGWPLNYMLCILGLFKTYFESAQPSGLSIREYVRTLECTRRATAVWKNTHNDIPKHYPQLIAQGFREVRRSNPLAVYRFADKQHPQEADLIDPDMSDVIPSLDALAQLAGHVCSDDERQREAETCFRLLTDIVVSNHTDQQNVCGELKLFIDHAVKYYVPYYQQLIDKTRADYEEKCNQEQEQCLSSSDVVVSVSENASH